MKGFALGRKEQESYGRLWVMGRWVIPLLAFVWYLQMTRSDTGENYFSPRGWRLTAVCSLFYLLQIKSDTLYLAEGGLLMTGLYCLAMLEGNLKVNEQFNSLKDV